MVKIRWLWVAMAGTSVVMLSLLVCLLACYSLLAVDYSLSLVCC